MPSTLHPATASGLPTSRRSILRGLAALPVVSVPALAAAATAEPDPVFALIEEHKAAAAFTETCHGDDEIAAAADIDSEIMHELAETVPQTIPGLRAMILHFADVQRRNGDDYDVGLAFPAIAEAVSTLFPTA